MIQVINVYGCSLSIRTHAANEDDAISDLRKRLHKEEIVFILGEDVEFYDEEDDE